MRINLFLQISLFLSLSFLEIKTKIANTLLIGVPKGGTHLLQEVFKKLTGFVPANVRLAKENILKNYSLKGLDNQEMPTDTFQLMIPSLDILHKCTNSLSNEYLISHMKYDKQYEELLKKNNFKIIMIIRDPRAQLISRVFYTKNVPFYPGLQHLNHDELLAGFMGIGSTSYQNFNDILTSHISYPNKPKSTVISRIDKFYQEFLPWMNSSICYVTKFENLVGIKGGGSQEKQIIEIINIAKHIGIHLDHNQAKKVGDSIFGNTSSFREGKIDSWKKYFTPYYKEEFKKIGGNLLKQLNYEENDNW